MLQKSSKYISTDDFAEAEAWAKSLKTPWYVEIVEISDDDGNEFMRYMSPDDWRSFKEVCEEIYEDLEHADEMDEYGNY